MKIFKRRHDHGLTDMGPWPGGKKAAEEVRQARKEIEEALGWTPPNDD